MKIFKSDDIKYVPASHEDQENPGVVKKILFKRKDISPGWIQMINWCSLKKKRAFRSHFHESMDEIFIIISGKVHIKAGQSQAVLVSGDAVYIKQGTIHSMDNLHSSDSIYIAIGIATQENGVSINV